MKSLLLALALWSVNAQAKEIRLALNWKPEPQFGGFYAAQFNDIFKEAGLDVKILEGGSGTPTTQMIAAGSTEYAIISADELVISHARGSKDIVALFATYQTNPQAIMVHTEHKYGKLEDLFKDDKAMLLWQSGLPYAQFLLKKFAPVKLKQAPYSGGVGSFLADKKIAQQCFVTSEPLTVRKQGGDIQTFLVADADYNPYTTVLVTQRSRLEKNKDEVLKLVRAVRKGWQAYLADPKSTNEKLQKMNPAMDAETFAKSAEAQVPLIQTPETKDKGLGFMSDERWNSLVGQLFDLKVIKAKPHSSDLFLLTGDLAPDKNADTKAK